MASDRGGAHQPELASLARFVPNPFPAMKSRREQYYDFERTIAFDFARATEAAALNTTPWLGRGDPARAEEAATDAIRGMFDLMNICGEVVVAAKVTQAQPVIAAGEHLGSWLPGTSAFDIAIDPIDGSTNVAKGMPNALSCLAASGREDGRTRGFSGMPGDYVSKLAYGPRVIRYMERAGVDSMHLQHPMEETLYTVSRALGKRVQDVVVQILDRERHARLIEEVRGAGAAVRLIQDGDIAAAIAPSLPSSGVDLYVGIGGTAEAILAAAAVRCLGGNLQCRYWPREEGEPARLAAEGHKESLTRVFHAADLALGPNILFCATGISDSPLLPGVMIKGHTAITHSVLMRAKSRTVRFITAHHDLEQKTIRLRSDCREHRI